MNTQINDNLVSLRVNEMIGFISSYIIGVETRPIIKKQLIDSKTISAFMLWGPPGIGKSDSLKGIAAKLTKTLGKRVIITDVRLLLFNPVDLRGIPVPDVNKEFAKWLKPEIFKMDDSDDVINILMLDEVSAAPPSVQAAAYQITLDRKIGEHKLPDNCYVIAAGNRLQDKSVAYKMPKALANRLIHTDIKVDYDDWKIWAYNNNIDSRILAYLHANPSNLFKFNPNNDDNAFPTPRSWSFVNTALKIFGTIDAAYYMIVGAIGIAAAIDFKTYCEVFDKLPNLDDIIAGKDIPVPTQPDVLYALITSIVTRCEKFTDKELENVIEYIKKMQSEFGAFAMKDMFLIESMIDKLPSLPCWVEWANAKRSIIL